MSLNKNRMEGEVINKIHTHCICVRTNSGHLLCRIQKAFTGFTPKNFFYFFNSIYYWDIKRGRLSKTRHGTDINEIFSAHYVKDHNTSQFQVPKQHHERYLSNYLNQNDSCPFIFYVPPILAMKDTCDQ